MRDRAITPLGADGVNGAEGDEELPPLHAANPSVDSASTAAVDPTCVFVAPGKLRGIGSTSTAVVSVLAKRCVSILRASLVRNCSPSPVELDNVELSISLTAA